LSLTGNLEDLPLLDILQIVSFSKKTGFLAITGASGNGAIVFRDGFVVCSFTDQSPPLGAQIAALPPPRRDGHIRRQIEIALEQLIRLREGEFNFNLADEPPPIVDGRDLTYETLAVGINPQELLLDLARGIDEDRRNSSAVIEASFAHPENDSFEEDLTSAPPAETLPTQGEVTTRPLVPTPAVAGPAARPAVVPATVVPATVVPATVMPPAVVPATVVPATVAAPSAVTPRAPAALPDVTSAEAAPGAAPETAAITGPPPRTVLLVDDEADVRALLTRRLVAGGYSVVEADDPDVALKKAQQLRAENTPFILCVDLGMPTSGGSSFQGGFEIVKRLGKMHLFPPVLLMTENPKAATQARARQMGINSVVFKPGLSKLDPEQFEADLSAFGQRLAVDLLPRLSQRSAPALAPRRAEPVRVQAMSEDEFARQFALLQKRVEDLRNPSNTSQISILIMKASRDFFERSLLLLVKNEELRGLGGFGKAPKDGKINLMAREIVIPLKEPSVFRDVASSRKPFYGEPPDGHWEQLLVGRIGRFRSGPVALIPLLSLRETIAILYGDNPESGRELGRLEALELFINQAGIALENVFLQRKIEVLQQQRV
jgi:CheY-like chemotaxis protein